MNLPGLGANCFLSNVSGTASSGGGSNYNSGALSQVTDPNTTLNNGCSVTGAGACTRRCTAGTAAPGTVCTLNTDCGSGGVCSAGTLCFDTGACANDAACLNHYCAAPTQAAANAQCGGAGAVCNVNQATYYDVSSNAPGGQNVNSFGCSNPAICNNAGWCELGTNAGGPCNVDADCAGGGTCRALTTYCISDVGVGAYGGCGRFQVCAGGTNANRLCTTFATAGSGLDCPGSSCTSLLPPLPPPSTPGQLCYNVTGLNLPATPGGGCPAVGNSKRILDRVGGGGLVCP
jgi:hypothetical protein